MEELLAKSGSLGPKTRSDCEIQLEIKYTGGISINLQSKVESMYGQSNRKLIADILSFFEIEHVEVYVKDKGALPFVIAARLEKAIHELIDTEKQYLLDVLETNKNETHKDGFRFTRLYLPGNAPSMMLNAGVHHPNGVILDLEDAVAPDKKEEARYIVRNALRSVNFYGAERMVRINQGEMGLKDLHFVVPHHVNLIMIPKCETTEEIFKIDAEIAKIRYEQSIDYPIWLMPIIESALGIENAFEIAKSSSNICAMAIGLEDFTADIGVQRTYTGEESLYARTRLVNACKAAGLQAIDSVFSDVSDMDALALNVRNSKALGFVGMGCIHPRQIATVYENFAPDAIEIEKAKKIVHAFKEAKAKGLGVVSIGSKMIDAPVVIRAELILKLAEQLGRI